MKTVLVISTLDTKGQETLYLKDKLTAIGLAPILMDISGRGSDIAGIDIAANRVAEAGGGNFEEIQSYFKGIINVFKQMNYSKFKEDKFNEFQKKLESLVAEKAVTS